MKQADMQIFDEGATTCCYAKSEKAWTIDPQGIAWETFLTTGEATVYGDDNQISSGGIPMARKSACCAPDMETVSIQIGKKDCR